VKKKQSPCLDLPTEPNSYTAAAASSIYNRPTDGFRNAPSHIIKSAENLKKTVKNNRRRGVVVSKGPVTTWMGDRLRAGIPSRYVGPNKSTRSTQPCIPPRSLNRVLASAGAKAGMSITSVGWQVTLCDPICHVSSIAVWQVRLLYTYRPLL